MGVREDVEIGDKDLAVMLGASGEEEKLYFITNQNFAVPNLIKLLKNTTNIKKAKMIDFQTNDKLKMIDNCKFYLYLIKKDQKTLGEQMFFNYEYKLVLNTDIICVLFKKLINYIISYNNLEIYKKMINSKLVQIGTNAEVGVTETILDKKYALLGAQRAIQKSKDSKFNKERQLINAKQSYEQFIRDFLPKKEHYLKEILKFGNNPWNFIEGLNFKTILIDLIDKFLFSRQLDLKDKLESINNYQPSKNVDYTFYFQFFEYNEYQQKKYNYSLVFNILMKLYNDSMVINGPLIQKKDTELIELEKLTNLFNWNELDSIININNLIPVEEGDIKINMNKLVYESLFLIKSTLDRLNLYLNIYSEDKTKNIFDEKINVQIHRKVEEIIKAAEAESEAVTVDAEAEGRTERIFIPCTILTELEDPITNEVLNVSINVVFIKEKNTNLKICHLKIWNLFQFILYEYQKHLQL